MVGTSAMVAFRARKASTARRKAGTVRTTMGLRDIGLDLLRFLMGHEPQDFGGPADLIRRERCRQDNSAMANLRQLDASKAHARRLSRRRTVEALDAPTRIHHEDTRRAICASSRISLDRSGALI